LNKHVSVTSAHPIME